MMRTLAIAMILAVPGRLEETWTATIAVKSTHCDECEKRLDAQLKLIPGVKDVTIGADKAAVTVTIAEKHAVKLGTLKAAIPNDMKLQRIDVSIRGTVAAGGKGVSVTAKESNARYDLADRDPKAGKVEELKKAMGGRNRFQISGEFVVVEGRETILLEKFAVAEWKD